MTNPEQKLSGPNPEDVQTMVRDIIVGLTNLDWCVGYEPTIEQLVELDRLRCLAWDMRRYRLLGRVKPSMELADADKI